MGQNRIYNEDLFTSKANEKFQKHIKTQSKRTLELVEEKIDWNRLLTSIEKKISKEREKLNEAGRKSFSIEVIVKCFILQRIYNLSDPRLEEEIADRRSFQIFLELNSQDSILDETTICRYRRELFARLDLDRKLFYEFNKQLKSLNLIVGNGTIIDATIKQAQATSSSNRDKDADFTKKRGRTYYGYKGHIAIDEDSEVIKTVEFTKASLHDSSQFDQLVDYSEQSVFADKGYANKTRRNKLEKHGIFDGILEKGYRDKPLTKSQIKLNKILSQIRNKVERPFAYICCTPKTGQ